MSTTASKAETTLKEGAKKEGLKEGDLAPAFDLPGLAGKKSRSPR